MAALTDAIKSFWPSAARRSNQHERLIFAIKEQASGLTELTDEQLQQRVHQLRTEVAGGTDPRSAEVMVPGFALVYEAARRTVGIAYYDVQLQAGIALSRNAIAQMATGEGKTFVGALPSFFYALHGRGVHFMTTTDYLAERDHEIISPIFATLGMTIGVLKADDSPEQKRAAYACDVTYGPGYEFGFDYLRDQVALLNQGKPRLGEKYRRRRRGETVSRVDMVQRGHAYAIVDELDSVLIDEATTPLILSGAPDDEHPHPETFHTSLATAAELMEDQDYIFEPATNKIRLTESGLAKAHTRLEEIAHVPLRRPWPEYVEQALHATIKLKRDVDYVIEDEEIQIVDQLTGRIFADRTWRNGLHQTVEAKEGLEVSSENEPLARMSRQQYFQLYDGLCGMTGTATGSEGEFRHFYDLGVSVIPPRKTNRRETLPWRFFGSEDTKWDAIALEVQRLNATGQPILVGTRTIETSHVVAARLDEMQLDYQLLNGKQDEEEAAIVARAGQRNAVMIATNVAGRGTDIKLGPGVEELGGLHVIVTEPNESQRVDRQLVGRAARQGNPGSCQTFVSADDELIADHAPYLADHLREQADASGEVHASLEHEVLKVQRHVEAKNYAQRKQLFARDTWLEDVLEKLAKDR